MAIIDGGATARPIRTVAVIMAMRAEAQPLIDRLRAVEHPLPESAGPLPVQWFDARSSGVTVVVSLNGKDRRHGVDKIATQPAVLNAYVTTLHRRPDLVISAGTAGGWARHGTEVGDVFVSRDQIVYHDRRIALPGFIEYGVGSYPSVDAGALARALGLKQGVVSSGNSLDESAEDRRAIQRSGAAVKEMEAASVAWIAELLGVPMLAIKAITDLVDAPAATGEQFVANLRRAAQRLTDVLIDVFDFCDGRTIADLA
jgi:5'-methylthioadenosine nucleosidase